MWAVCIHVRLRKRVYIFQLVQILIIEGETGSGKTTQIPQYLYEAVSDNSVSVLTPCHCILTTSSIRDTARMVRRLAVHNLVEWPP